MRHDRFSMESPPGPRPEELRILEGVLSRDLFVQARKDLKPSAPKGVNLEGEQKMGLSLSLLNARLAILHNWM